jgi:hypothetical protein
MRLYRFRSDLNPEHTLDILRNRRLFCSRWHELNDPMEGTYSTLKGGRSTEARPGKAGHIRCEGAAASLLIFDNVQEAHNVGLLCKWLSRAGD